MITPSEFRNLRRGRARELEAALDDAIVRAAATGIARAIKFATLGWEPHVIEWVVAGYRAAGWKADVVIDNRDGDFVQLEAP